MKRFTAAAARSAARHVRRNATANESSASAASQEVKEKIKEAAEERFYKEMPRPKREALPEDGTVVYRKGVPVRGSLSRLPMREKFIMCMVFSITGSSAVYFVRPSLKYLVDNGFMGLPKDSSFSNGPWLYRFLYFAVMWPTYTFLLYMVGGIFGRRIWFSMMIIKMWSRVLPKRVANYLRYMLDVY